MARNQFNFQKRQKELEKKKKRAEKLARRQERKALGPTEDEIPTVNQFGEIIPTPAAPNAPAGPPAGAHADKPGD